MVYSVGRSVSYRVLLVDLTNAFFHFLPLLQLTGFSAPPQPATSLSSACPSSTLKEFTHNQSLPVRLECRRKSEGRNVSVKEEVRTSSWDFIERNYFGWIFFGCGQCWWSICLWWLSLPVWAGGYKRRAPTKKERQQMEKAQWTVAQLRVRLLIDWDVSCYHNNNFD